MITSPANEKLKLLRKLQDGRWRDKLGLFVAEGEDLVEAARAAGIDPVELLVAGENVAPELLASVSDQPHPPRVVAVYRRADLVLAGLAPIRRSATGGSPQAPGDSAGVSEPRPSCRSRRRDVQVLPSNSLVLTVALWRVVDPGNVGAVVRTAAAFGASVALSPGCADPTSPRALRASAGAIFRVPLVGFEDAPGRRVALVAHGGRPLVEVSCDRPLTFVLGAEREGLPDDVVARCDETATIPTSGAVESLNVAAAAAIALYEVARRR